MTVPRRAAAGLATLITAAALLLTGCMPGAKAQPQDTQSVSSDDARAKEMQQKLDDAESAAAQADSDAAQNN
ncbi:MULTISPECIES: hypothetical protein [unclassified Streptomyces]|uniref:hypothetical protein n=1 Tax=unclassified Streptomyces TaxID=2593676 RepID=UPI0022524602|nr:MULTISPECIES: hypothetical protein [unclassified Streptomyces]MCX4631768.1 hypothetical protein [Streptomyces sp. NBC_01443]WSW47605.1 hypothetical protein OG296_33370 [Streptomyces sp. NBC_01001]